MLSWIRKRLPPGRPRTLSRSRPRLEALEDRLVLSPPGSGWQLLWSDEFNGTSLDTSKWAVATGTRRDAVNTAGALSVGGGNLTVTTYTSGGTNYTGFIGTYNSFKATYGYWEARINFRDSPGMWSAFWLQSPTMGNPLGNPAAAGTEIDIAEHRAVDSAGTNISNKSESNLHWDGYGASHKSVGSGLENNPSDTSLQGNFHLYAVQWSPAGYQFYIDGTQVWSTTQAVSQRSEFIYLTSFTVSVTTAGQSVAAASGCAAASDRVAPLRSAPSGGSSCGEAAPVADSPRPGSAPRRSAPGPAAPSAPASAFFPRLVSCVRNQVASRDKA